MFIPTKRILLKKGDFFEKYILFSNGEFLKTGNFLKNTEFCVKTPSLERGIFENTEFLKKTRNFVLKLRLLNGEFLRKFFDKHIDPYRLLKKASIRWQTLENQRLKR